jgi:hypothetical protein
MENITKNSIFSIFALGLSLVLLGLSTYKVFALPMTIDECTTYYMLVEMKSNWQVLFDMKSFDTANNHILNTYFARIGYFFFGQTEIALRWGSLLAHVIYLFFSWKLSKKLTESSWFSLGIFVAMNVNPYMLDFFSLSRGYGIMLAMIVASLYYFYENKIWKSCIAIALGVLGNFTMINYMISFCGLYFIFLLLEKNDLKAFFKKIIPPLVIFSLLGALIFRPIMELKKNGEFLYGNESLKEVFKSILYNSGYHAEYLGKDGLEIIAYIYSFLILGGIFISVFQYVKEKNTQRLLIAFFPLLSIFIMILQFYFLGSKYLINRTALLYFPLLMLSIFPWFLLKNIYIKNIITCIILIFSVFHFSETYIPDYCYEWSADDSAKKVVQYIEERAAKDHKKYVLQANNNLLQSVYFHYQKTKNPNIEVLQYRPALTKDTLVDFYYIFENQKSEINEIYNKEVRNFHGQLILEKSG